MAVAEKKQSPKELAAKFAAKAEEYGFGWSVQGSSFQGVVKVWKKFPIGSSSGFADAEMGASILFDYVPLKGGSVWGTDGGSIGGMVAIQNGIFKLNKSGSGKLFIAALSKLQKSPSPWG